LTGPDSIATITTIISTWRLPDARHDREAPEEDVPVPGLQSSVDAAQAEPAEVPAVYAAVGEAASGMNTAREHERESIRREAEGLRNVGLALEPMTFTEKRRVLVVLCHRFLVDPTKLGSVDQS
jgi:hypothetical protein